MKKLVYIASMVVLLASFGGASPEADSDDSEIIGQIQGMFPVKDVKEGFRVLEILKGVSDADFAVEKASVLVKLYESQNTEQADMAPDPAGHPQRRRELQMTCLFNLGELSAEKAAPFVIKVLINYIQFMDSQAAPRPRASLQLSMAHLINVHIENKEIRNIARRYLASSAIKEWTKGRIATELLDYNVRQISESYDPDCSRRLSMISDTVNLDSLGQALKAPKRLGRSAQILSALVENKPELLSKFLQSQKLLNNSQKYFFAYAIIFRSVESLRKCNALGNADYRLIKQAKKWQRELEPEISGIVGGDHILKAMLDIYNPMAECTARLLCVLEVGGDGQGRLLIENNTDRLQIIYRPDKSNPLVLKNTESQLEVVFRGSSYCTDLLDRTKTPLEKLKPSLRYAYMVPFKPECSIDMHLGAVKLSIDDEVSNLPEGTYCGSIRAINAEANDDERVCKNEIVISGISLPDDSVKPGDKEFTLSVILRPQLEKYRLGEPVPAKIGIVNNSNMPVKIFNYFSDFSESNIFEFTVKRLEGGVFVENSKKLNCVTLIVPHAVNDWLTILPGETLWYSTDISSVFDAEGQYQISATFIRGPALIFPENAKARYSKQHKWTSTEVLVEIHDQ